MLGGALYKFSKLSNYICHRQPMADTSHVMRKPVSVICEQKKKSVDQPAHLRSLISAFVVHCLDSIILLPSISKLSSLYLASVAAETSLSLPGPQTSKTGFLVTGLSYDC